MTATRYCITLRHSHEVRVPAGVRIHAWRTVDYGVQVELIADVQPGVVWTLPETAVVEILEPGSRDNPPMVAPLVRTATAVDPPAASP
jgi:hypothetical protein